MVKQSNQAARGNTLQILHYSIHLLPGEKFIRSIRRSRVLYYKRLLPPALLLVLVLVLVLVLTVVLHGPIEIVAGVIVLVLLVWMILIRFDYRHHICVLTSHRIIDIERRLIREKRIETEYDNIREVRVDIDSLFERLFRIGTVHIETLSKSPDSDIRLRGVDRPLDIQDKIYELRDQFEQEEYGQDGLEQRLVKDLLAAITTLTKTGP